MNNNKGLLMLSRGFFNHKYWQEDRVYSKAEAWLDLLQTAKYQDEMQIVKSKVISLKRGELVASNRFLQQRWGWSNNKVRNYIKNLVKMQMVRQESDAGETVLTLVKYDDYNTMGDSRATAITTAERQESDGEATNIKKERNKERKEGKKDLFDLHFLIDGFMCDESFKVKMDMAYKKVDKINLEKFRKHVERFKPDKKMWQKWDLEKYYENSYASFTKNKTAITDSQGLILNLNEVYPFAQ